jgi:uncharacterized protein YcbK (DUF882 family)
MERIVPGALADINRLLRDHRTNDVWPIDRQLLSLLERITSLTGTNDTLHVISGYRSPLTNRTLADRSDGVSRPQPAHGRQGHRHPHSPAATCKALRNAALSLRGAAWASIRLLNSCTSTRARARLVDRAR